MQRLKDAWQHGETHRQVARLAFPMMLSNLSTPVVALVNNTVVGHLPYAYQLGAAAVGGMLYVIMVNLLNFLRMGTTSLSAQAFGRNDSDALRHALWQGTLLALLIALVSIAITLPCAQLLLSILHGSPELQTAALTFFRYRLLGLPAALISLSLMGWLLGTQNARAVLTVVLLTNIGNALLSLFLVLGLGWGIKGAAMAAACSEWAGLLLGTLLATRELARHPGRWHPQRLLQWSSWRGLLAINRDLFIRSLTLQGVFLLLTLQGGRLGDTTVAANALLLNGLELSAYALDGLAHALEALAGRAIGARDRLSLQRSLIVTAIWSWLAAATLGLFFLLGGHLFIALQTDIQAVRQVAFDSLPYLAALPPLAVLSYLLDGLFVGAARAREMRDSMLLAFVLAAPVAILCRRLGNDGLWLTFLAFMLLRGVLLGAQAWRIQHRDGWT